MRRSPHGSPARRSRRSARRSIRGHRGPAPFPLRFEVEYPEKVSRATTLVRLILAVPQLLIIYALSTVTGIITFVAWFAILFTQRYPKGLFDSSRWSPTVGWLMCSPTRAAL